MRLRWGWLLTPALFLLALVLRLKLLDTPPYGDEPMHYWMARHFSAPPANLSDVQGSTWFHPGWIVWQRPAYYVAMHPFALQGFTAFRIGHALWSSLLPAVAYGLLRQSGLSRVAAVAGGLFTATLPSLVTWGGLGLMDEPMTVLFVAGLWALQAGRPLAAAALLLLAVWTKETAFFGLAALAACAALRGLWRRTNQLRPVVQLDDATAALALATAVALGPLFVSTMKGLKSIGAPSGPHAAALADALFVTPWFLLPLLVGLAFPRSRRLAAWGLGLGASHLLLNVALHRAVEAWYTVWPVTFAGLGAIAGCEAAVRWAWRGARPWAKPAASALAGAVLVLLAALVLVPASAAKAAATHPFTGETPPSLAESLEFEHRHRDRARLDAFAALHANASTTVLAVDLFYPHDLYPLAESVAHIYVDSAQARLAFALDVHPFAAVAARDHTMLLLAKTGLPFDLALRHAYAACQVFENSDFLVYESWRCGDQAAALAAG